MINAVSNVNFSAVSTAYQSRQKSNVAFKGGAASEGPNILERIIVGIGSFLNRRTHPDRTHKYATGRLWGGLTQSGSALFGIGGSIVTTGYIGREAWLNFVDKGDYATGGLDTLGVAFGFGMIFKSFQWLRQAFRSFRKSSD